MDKRSILAFVLIGIVLAIWLIVSSIYQRPPLKQDQTKDSTKTEKQIVDSSNVVQSDTAAIDSLNQAPQLNSDTLKYGSFFSDYAKAEDIEITIETDLFTTKISNKGAGISFWELKKYKHNNGTPAQLIESQLGELFMLFETRERNKIDTRDFYFTFD